MSSPINAVVAMDWGGTWIRVAVVERGRGRRLGGPQCQAPKGGRSPSCWTLPAAMLARGFEQGKPLGLGGLGIAIAGPVDADTGMMFHPPNLPSLNGISVKTYFEAGFGCTAWIGNDANLAALGEFRYGAGKDAREQGRPSTTLAYVTVSTGIGGGVVDRGRMFLGVNGLATEVGHMSIDGRPRGYALSVWQPRLPGGVGLWREHRTNRQGAGLATAGHKLRPVCNGPGINHFRSGVPSGGGRRLPGSGYCRGRTPSPGRGAHQYPASLQPGLGRVGRGRVRWPRAVRIAASDP